MNLVFRSKKKGLNRLFGEIEAEVMDILWKKGPLKGREVHEALKKKKHLAFTTVLTVLDRLSKKGLVTKARGSGLIMFSAAVSRKAFAERTATELIRSAYDLSPDLTISAFTDIFSTMKPEELSRLSELIEEKRDENRGKN